MSGVQGSLFDAFDAGDEPPGSGGSPAPSEAPAVSSAGPPPLGAGRPDARAVLDPWRAAGVLHAADVHVATTLARLAGLGDADGGLDAAEVQVLLGAALAARAPRLGHVCLDLATVRASVPAEVESDADTAAAGMVEALPWPADVDGWRSALAGSPLVAEVDPLTGRAPTTGSGRGVPLVLDGTLLYLERYRAYEDAMAAELLRRAGAGAVVSGGRVDGGAGSAGVGSPAPALVEVLGLSPAQRAAAESGASGLLSVIVGGPGTGKTTTVAALLAHLLDAAPTARIALVAPTGKAAARMGESIAALAERLRTSPAEAAAALADRLAAAEVATVHRLLGSRPDGTFRHHAHAPLAHDVVIVDETSMVSLPLMAHLLDAVRPDARLVLVGDPGQLASVEAGSVLGDVAGPAVDAALAGDVAPEGPLALCVSVLTESYRFPAGSPVGRFAAAVRAGDPDAVLAVLAAGSPFGLLSGPGPGPGPGPGSVSGEGGGSGPAVGSDGVRLSWEATGGDTDRGAAAVEAAALGGARATLDAARNGDAEAALAALAAVRVLCAHRRGPFGVARWNWEFEGWLAGEGPRPGGFYVGRPVLVSANDPLNGLANGDLGVVVDAEPAPRVAFPGQGGARLVAPSRLEAVETVHAMTIHKSQGSEFDEIVVVLPPADSRLATRELLYTAVTRARRAVTLVGEEAALRTAVANRVVRQTGLRARLWGAGA